MLKIGIHTEFYKKSFINDGLRGVSLNKSLKHSRNDFFIYIFDYHACDDHNSQMKCIHVIEITMNLVLMIYLMKHLSLAIPSCDDKLLPCS